MEKFTTPIMKMNTDLTGVHLYIKRDDLLPFSFGGLGCQKVTDL